MKNLFRLMSILIGTILFSLFLINADQTTNNDDTPQSENDYRTILYTCTTGETLERCWYNGGGCNISSQWLCASEQ